MGKRKTFSSLREKYKNDLIKARQRHLTKAQKTRESPTLQERQEKITKEYKKKKRELVEEKINKLLSKKMSYKSGNPLVKLLKSKGKVPHIPIYKREKVNLWK